MLGSHSNDLLVFDDDAPFVGGDLTEQYGGKAAGLYRLARMGLPIPKGYAVPCQTCMVYRSAKDVREFNEHLIADKIGPLYDQWFRDQHLVSVRSGAPVSMPGMMDTILDVGMTEANMGHWRSALGNRTALDCLRRYLQMMGTSYFDLPADQLEYIVKQMMKLKLGGKRLPTCDADFRVEHLQRIIRGIDTLHRKAGYVPELVDPYRQLSMAVHAVYASYWSDRAMHYRAANQIDHDMGTAVIVQQMVFGNRDAQSCSGVLFSRDPMTGDPSPVVDFLPEAQGEDVVSGVRDTLSADELQDWNPDVHEQLMDYAAQLEDEFDDMVDVEFTVDGGELYLLQCRVGKRSAQAAFRIIRDRIAEGTLTREAGLSRLTVDQAAALDTPRVVDPPDPTLTGLPVCGGVVTGLAVMSTEQAINCKQPCILLREMTDADDVIGMSAAIGVLTQTGGVTCHAAVVARSMHKPCIVGAAGLGDVEITPGETMVTIDGSTGRVWFDLDHPLTLQDQPDATLTEWMFDTEDGLPTMLRVSHTGTGCWVDVYDPICVDTTNLETADEVYDMLLEALESPIAAIDLREPVSQVADLFHRTLGIDGDMAVTSNVDALIEGLGRIAEEFETGPLVLLLDPETQAFSHGVFVAMGYRVIRVANDLRSIVMSNGPCIVGPSLIGTEGIDPTLRLARLKQLDDPEFTVYDYPMTRQRRVVEMLKFSNAVGTLAEKPPE